MKTITKQIIDAKTSGQRAAATRRLNNFVEAQETEGFDPVMVRAAVKANVTKLLNKRRGKKR